MTPDDTSPTERIVELLAQGGELFRQNRAEPSLERVEAALELARKNLSPGNVLYGTCVVNAADLHMTLGNYRTAEQLLTNYLDTTDHEGSRNATVATRAGDALINLYIRTGRFDAAEPLLLQKLAGEGLDLSTTIAARSNLVTVYVGERKFDPARQQLAALEAIRDALPPHHPDAAEIDAVVSTAQALVDADPASWPAPSAQSEIGDSDAPACEASTLDPSQRGAVERAYQAFASHDYVGFGRQAISLDAARVRTPEILVLSLASLRALGRDDLAGALLPHVQRQLSRFPWHRRMIDLVFGNEPLETVTRDAPDDVARCQASYYAAVRLRLAGQWTEADVYIDAARTSGAACPERQLAQLDGQDVGATLANTNITLRILAEDGRLAQATALARAAVAFGKRHAGAGATELATTLWNLAAILAQQGQVAESLRLHEEARALEPLLSDEDALEQGANLGQIYLEAGAYPEARAVLEEALARADHDGNAHHRARAAALNALGLTALASGNPADALGLYDKAIAELEGDGTTVSIERAIFEDNAAQSLQLLGRSAGALVRHDHARALLIALRDDGTIPASHPSIAKNLANRAFTLLRLDRLPEAEQSARDAVTSSTAAGPGSANAYAVLAWACWANGRAGDALDAFLYMTALNDATIGDVLALGSETLRMNYVAMAKLDLSMLVSLATAAAPDAPTLERVFDVVLRRKSLAGEATLVRRDASARYASLAPAPEELDLGPLLRSVTMRGVANSVPRDWTILEYLRLPLLTPPHGGSPMSADDVHYWCFVIPPGELAEPRLVDLGSAVPIDDAVVKWHAALSAPIQEDTSTPVDLARARRAVAAGRRLRALVVDPVAASLIGGGHVVIAQDGALARIPFETLPLEGSGYLSDSYTCSYVGTSRDLLRLVRGADPVAAPPVVIANPDFDFGGDPSATPATPGRFTSLAGTVKEGAAVATLLGVTPLTGPDVLEPRVRALVSPRVLHIATHGFFDDSIDDYTEAWAQRVVSMAGIVSRIDAPPNPLSRSGLALAGANRGAQSPHSDAVGDGILTAADVVGVDLRNTELVVLSACETGLGEVHATEGVMGLRRAFLLAGAKTVVVSLWKVPDEITCELMEDFYRRLLSGMPRSDALVASQLALQVAHPSPSAWGAFICFGGQGPLSGTVRALTADRARPGLPR